MKIAWGITGAGHYLSHSVDVIEKLLKEGHEMDIFLSAAAKVVLKMYKLLPKIEDLKHNEDLKLNKIFHEDDQKPAYPISAHFNLNYYDLLILSPITSNSVGKMSHGIADTLITNIFAQMIKGNGNIYCVPSDLVSGEIKTEVPGGKLVNIHIDNFNSQNAQNLTQFPNVENFTHPSEIFEKMIAEKTT